MSAPTALKGFVDDAALSTSAYAEVVDLLLENIPALVHPTSIKTLAAMRYEPQLASILRSYQLAIERARWSIDPSGAGDEVTQQIADDLGLPIKGDNNPTPTGARRRRFTWAAHLSTALRLQLTFGHAAFAQQWELANGRWRLAMVQERMPQTLSMLKFNPDGTLAGVSQEGTAAGSDAPVIRTANHELVWYCREREGSNYWGQSLLRAGYAPWLIKVQMLRVHATSIRRFGMGIPYGQGGANWTPEQYAELDRALTRYQASEGARISVPAGGAIKLAGLSGSVPDALAFINYLDRLMTRATLTSILDMATAEKGNRSLGETVMALMVYAQTAEAERIAAAATDQIVIPLVDANWGDTAPAPRIVVDDVGTDPELTAEDLNWLTQYGALRMDAPARAHVRRHWNFPPEDPNDPVNKAADTAALTAPEAP